MPPPANDIDRWFQHARRRENRAVSLYTSLLTGKLFGYFGYRLRYSLLLDAARFAVHVLEFLILLSSLGGLAALTVMVLRIGGLIISGGWWGLLEVMRERLRGFARTGQREAAEREIGRWLALSVIVAVMMTVGGAVVLVLFQPHSDPIARLYAFLVILELAIGFPVRVLHSGVYATRRVYRPIWSMFAPIAVQLIVLSAGYYFYPTAAMMIAIIASNAIGIVITVHYTLEVYRLTGITPHRGPHTGVRLLPSIPPRLGAETMLAGLGLRLDAVVVLAILGIYGTSTRSFDLTAGVWAWRQVDAFQFFYLILPLLRGAYEGTGLFYFDFVRLRSVPALHDYRMMFFRNLLWMTPLIALYFWVLAVGLTVFVLDDVPMSFLVALLPLFLLRGVIGIYQTRLFAERHYRSLMATIALLAALLALVWIDTDPASDLLQITAAMITLLIVLINLQHLRDRRDPALPTQLALGDWLHVLARETGPVTVGTLNLPQSITSRQRSAAMTLVDDSVCGRGYFALRSPNTLMYYQRAVAATDGAPLHLSVQESTGGAAGRGRAMAVTDGRAAAEELVAACWLTPADDDVPRPESLDELSAEFRALFPGGVVIDLTNRAAAQEVRGLDGALLAEIVPTALGGLDGGATVVPLADRALTPIHHGGRLRRLFVLPPEPDVADTRRWSHIVTAWHLHRG